MPGESAARRTGGDGSRLSRASGRSRANVACAILAAVTASTSGPDGEPGSRDLQMAPETLTDAQLGPSPRAGAPGARGQPGRPRHPLHLAARRRRHRARRRAPGPRASLALALALYAMSVTSASLTGTGSSARPPCAASSPASRGRCRPRPSWTPSSPTCGRPRTPTTSSWRGCASLTGTWRSRWSPRGLTPRRRGRRCAPSWRLPAPRPLAPSTRASARAPEVPG